MSLARIRPSAVMIDSNRPASSAAELGGGAPLLIFAVGLIPRMEVRRITRLRGALRRTASGRISCGTGIGASVLNGMWADSGADDGRVPGMPSRPEARRIAV